MAVCALSEVKYELMVQAWAYRSCKATMTPELRLVVGRGLKMLRAELRDLRATHPVELCPICTGQVEDDYASLANYDQTFGAMWADRDAPAHVTPGKKTWLDPNRFVSPDGYVFLRRPQGGFIAEHRLRMERSLGRPLRDNESVHHRNGIRHDNRDDNLELWVGGIRYGQRADDLACGECGTSWRAQTPKRLGEVA